jgi:tetratricopeptide (TPR) repeat protein
VSSFRPRNRLVFLFVGLLGSSTALWGQAPTFAGEPFASSREELRAASAAIPVDHEYSVQVLLEEGQYVIAKDGTLAYRYRMIYRVDAPDAVENWSVVSAQWDPWFEKPAQLHARVLQGDGQFVELDQKTITDAPVKVEDAETFSSEHVRRAPLPGVSVGSIVEQVEDIDEKTPYFPGGGVYRFAFRGNVPVAHVRMVVDMPAAMPFNDSAHDLSSLTIKREETNERRHVVYEQSAMPAEHNSDIDLPTNEPPTPMVEFATGASWKAVAATYAGISDPETIPADTQSILPTDLPNERQARIRAIVARLHAEVRYTGVEFGAARLTPQRPSDVIQRHYGDCKDKATLLVAMLRQVGIPANLALLSTGPGHDVSPALPGMTQFNHAIVYVPATRNEKALWIDATATYFQPGTLPWEDSGRMALVIAPETTKLTRTPDPTPQNSSLIETRTFMLSAFGPSHVTENSETHGIIDATYRASYGGPDNKKIHEELENYAKTAYNAKSLTKVTHSDPEDLSQPFHLTLEVEGARRGITVMDEALVAVLPSVVLDSLPPWFKTRPVVVGPDTKEEEKHQLELAEKSRAASYTFRPLLDERRVRMIVPDGFKLRTLPPNKTTKLGPATLTESYSADEPGVVTATLHFDSGPGSLTVDQALAMRAAVLDFEKREYVGIYFDQTAAKAFAAGHIREALDTDRWLIAAHPTEALHHVRLARLLLEARIGDAARAEAQRATQLDPKSSTAFDTYGWTLQHDALGVRFGKGFDLQGAIAAYKQAIALDPDNNDSRFDLGILYEFDASGIRYAADANLPTAIGVYRELLEKNKDKDPATLAQWQNNLLYALLFDKQFSELDKMLTTLPYNSVHASLAISSAAARNGAAAGIAQAEKGNVDAADRNKNLLAAGSLLSQMRKYQEAAEVLRAGIGGGEDAPATARQIEMYKSLKPAALEPLPATNPASPVRTITVGVLAGTLTEQQATKSLARQAYTTDAELQRDVQKNLASSGFLRAVAAKSDMTEPVLLDLIAGNMTYSSSGDDASGYAIVAQSPGSDPNHYYVVREDGAYRVVADDSNSLDSNMAIGVAVLYAMEHANPKQAKAILDWKRDLTHRRGDDDVFAGPLLPRFWTVGSSKEGADSPAAMRLAAISLLAGSMDAKPYLAEVEADRAKASGQRQTDLDLLLAVAGDGAEQPLIALPAAMRLLDQEPDSLTAMRLAGQAYALQNDSASWLSMLAPRLAKKPKDHDLLEQQASAYELAHDYVAARKSQQGAIDSGKAQSTDYNSYAWLALFDDHTGDDALKAAQQSTMQSKQGSFAELHTLACIYAAEGRTTEARQTLDQAMYAGNQSQPNSAVWYALGLLYEQYGANDAALSAYRKVQAHEFDEHTYIDPMSTYLLAQQRITKLSGK